MFPRSKIRILPPSVLTLLSPIVVFDVSLRTESKTQLKTKQSSTSKELFSYGESASRSA